MSYKLAELCEQRGECRVETEYNRADDYDRRNYNSALTKSVIPFGPYYLFEFALLVLEKL